MCDLHPTRCALVTAVSRRAVSRHSVTRFSPQAKISSYKFQVSSYLLQHCVVVFAAEWPPNPRPCGPICLCLPLRSRPTQSIVVVLWCCPNWLEAAWREVRRPREDHGTEGWCSKVSCSLLFAAMRLLRKHRNSQGKFPRFSAKVSPQFTSQVVGL